MNMCDYLDRFTPGELGWEPDKNYPRFKVGDKAHPGIFGPYVFEGCKGFSVVGVAENIAMFSEYGNIQTVVLHWQDTKAANYYDSFGNWMLTKVEK